MEALAVAMFLAVVVKAILDYVAEPIRTKFPELDLWWFNYVALVAGGIVSWFAALNLFETYIANALLGRILTALLIGGGSKLLNDVFTNAPGRGPTDLARGLETYSQPGHQSAKTNGPRARGW